MKIIKNKGNKISSKLREDPRPKIWDAEELWKVAWTYITTVIDTAREPFLVLDADLRVLSANKVFYRFFQVTIAETENKLVYELGDGQWDIPDLKKLLENILPKNKHFNDYVVDHVFPKIGRNVMLLNARRIYKTGEKVPIILLAMEDITRRKELEEMLRDYAGKLNAELTRKTTGLETRVLQLEALNDAL
jgi:PAS domain S-box-containing protein